MIIGVPREKAPETRVAVTPAQVRKLAALGGEVRIESGAGAAAGFDDAAYESAGAAVAASRREALACPVVLQVNVMDDEPQELNEGQVLLGFAEPLSGGARLEALASRGVTLFALELLRGITRAQAMDALSSMATLAGYKAVLVAAERLPRMLPMMVTAAGTLTPAKALVGRRGRGRSPGDRDRQATRRGRDRLRRPPGGQGRGRERRGGASPISSSTPSRPATRAGTPGASARTSTGASAS